MRTVPRGFRTASLVLLVLAATAALAAGRDEWQQPDRVVADLNLRDGSVVADVGCGGGYFISRLAKAVGKTGTVWAEDISEKSLRGLKQRVEKDANLANVKVVKGEAESTGLPDAALDAALVVNVYHHVPEKHRAGLTADIVRALKPGGCVFLIDWRVDAEIHHDRNRRIPRDDLVAMMTGAGLELDAEFLYLPHQVFLRFRRPRAAE
ncbi:MAG: methyltransferase domain-containing protein [Phycisphaerae bacterium]